MSDYIKREDAILEIQKFGVGAQDFEDYTPEQAERFVIGRLQNILAADVAPVVRCKDCRYSDELLGGLNCSHGVCVDCTVPEDFFCADGKRKGGEA